MDSTSILVERHPAQFELPTEAASSDYARIAAALRYLETHYREQPTLDDAASYVGLSPAHFQRLFRRWAGISPKRFVQYLTIGYAKTQLAASRSVLDATYAAGLSSPGRLHDLFVAVEAVTPGEFKQRGAGLEIVYGFHQTPFGECLLAVTVRGICALQFVEPGQQTSAVDAVAASWPAATLAENPAETQAWADAVFPRDTRTGTRRVSLLVAGTNFQVKVWEALLRIPPGRMRTYGDVAREIGCAGAARAVGSAVGANPIAYIIPCHRVIRSSGSFGDYRWGDVRKRAILGWEAAQLESHRVSDAVSRPIEG